MLHEAPDARATLTPRQRQILQYIQVSVKDRGYPPSIREIGLAVGLSSSSTVHSHLHTLERMGLIKRDPTKPRAIEVAHSASGQADSIAVPIWIGSGPVPLYVEDETERLVLPRTLVGDGPCFAWRVIGVSMKEGAILPGDWVVAVLRPPTHGEIVIAILDGTPTLHRYMQATGHIRLEPDNHRMRPITVKNPVIAGPVVAVFRRLEHSPHGGASSPALEAHGRR